MHTKLIVCVPRHEENFMRNIVNKPVFAENKEVISANSGVGAINSEGESSKHSFVRQRITDPVTTEVCGFCYSNISGTS